MAEQSEETTTKLLKCGKRTYFFDIKEATNGSKYLKITESRFVKEGEARRRNSLILFKDDVSGFLGTMEEVRESLEE
ncbi:DUF3276 family protein [Candidatus Roizmanbacteria bacterium]|nr:DUF3276 family protein [Candidatus Roizmanbacteria bacterium]